MSAPECVLVVEAEILVRQPLAEYLRECGFRVAEAVSAAEARALLEAGKLAIDLVLADAAADADAIFGLAQWLRQSKPEIEVVLAGTPLRTAEQAGEICNDGPALVKPYEHKLVLEHIKRLLARRKR
jgi:DNA-binding response OmpR family regulator